MAIILIDILGDYVSIIRAKTFCSVLFRFHCGWLFISPENFLSDSRA